jgi:hypothetical protein
VLGSVSVISAVRVGDQPEQVPGPGVTAAIPEVPRDLPHAAAGQIEGAQPEEVRVGNRSTAP